MKQDFHAKNDRSSQRVLYSMQLVIEEKILILGPGKFRLFLVWITIPSASCVYFNIGKASMKITIWCVALNEIRIDSNMY